MWSQVAAPGAGAVAAAIAALAEHVLPASQAAANLIYAAASLTGVSDKVLKDICGDITWTRLRTVRYKAMMMIMILMVLYSL